jgi:uncharacterized protein involved in type VI secretion and phage assembly
MSNAGIFDLFDSESKTKSKSTNIDGIVVAEVVSSKDDGNMGRILVKFPWYSDNNKTDYVRMCNLMAGKDRGSVFLPEQGDEVICAFINGDINRPICLGSLYDVDNKPPADNSDGNNDIKKIKTRSGHEISFNDKNANESIEIKSKSGHTIIFNDAPGKEKITIKDKTGNNHLEIDSIANSITINAGLSIDIKATTINIEASSSLQLKSGAVLKAEGTPIMLN